MQACQYRTLDAATRECCCPHLCFQLLLLLDHITKLCDALLSLMQLLHKPLAAAASCTAHSAIISGPALPACRTACTGLGNAGLAPGSGGHLGPLCHG